MVITLRFYLLLCLVFGVNGDGRASPPGIAAPGERIGYSQLSPAGYELNVGNGPSTNIPDGLKAYIVVSTYASPAYANFPQDGYGPPPTIATPLSPPAQTSSPKTTKQNSATSISAPGSLPPGISAPGYSGGSISAPGPLPPGISAPGDGSSISAPGPVPPGISAPGDNWNENTPVTKSPSITIAIPSDLSSRISTPGSRHVARVLFKVDKGRTIADRRTTTKIKSVQSDDPAGKDYVPPTETAVNPYGNYAGGQLSTVSLFPPPTFSSVTVSSMGTTVFAPSLLPTGIFPPGDDPSKYGKTSKSTLSPNLGAPSSLPPGINPPAPEVGSKAFVTVTSTSPTLQNKVAANFKAPTDKAHKNISQEKDVVLSTAIKISTTIAPSTLSRGGAPTPGLSSKSSNAPKSTSTPNSIFAPSSVPNGISSPGTLISGNVRIHNFTDKTFVDKSTVEAKKLFLRKPAIDAKSSDSPHASTSKTKNNLLLSRDITTSLSGYDGYGVAITGSSSTSLSAPGNTPIGISPPGSQSTAQSSTPSLATSTIFSPSALPDAISTPGYVENAYGNYGGGTPGYGQDRPTTSGRPTVGPQTTIAAPSDLPNGISPPGQETKNPVNAPGVLPPSISAPGDDGKIDKIKNPLFAPGVLPPAISTPSNDDESENETPSDKIGAQKRLLSNVGRASSETIKNQPKTNATSAGPRLTTPKIDIDSPSNFPIKKANGTKKSSSNRHETNATIAKVSIGGDSNALPFETLPVDSPPEPTKPSKSNSKKSDSSKINKSAVTESRPKSRTRHSTTHPTTTQFPTPSRATVLSQVNNDFISARASTNTSLSKPALSVVKTEFQQPSGSNIGAPGNLPLGVAPPADSLATPASPATPYPNSVAVPGNLPNGVSSPSPGVGAPSPGQYAAVLRPSYDSPATDHSAYGPSINPNCVDVHPKCEYFVSNGKCLNPQFSAFVRQVCPRSCRSCEVHSYGLHSAGGNAPVGYGGAPPSVPSGGYGLGLGYGQGGYGGGKPGLGPGDYYFGPPTLALGPPNGPPGCCGGGGGPSYAGGSSYGTGVYVGPPSISNCAGGGCGIAPSGSYGAGPQPATYGGGYPSPLGPPTYGSSSSGCGSGGCQTGPAFAPGPSGCGSGGCGPSGQIFINSGTGSGNTRRRRWKNVLFASKLM